MALSLNDADHIATLINTRNRLTRPYTTEMILADQDKYIVRRGDDGTIIGVARVEVVQWYQCEIKHVSVDPMYPRRGIGTWLVEQCEARARHLGARIAQCTIRTGNLESEGLFGKKCKYLRTVTFRNERSGHDVSVYQKVLVAGVSGNEPRGADGRQ